MKKMIAFFSVGIIILALASVMFYGITANGNYEYVDDNAIVLPTDAVITISNVTYERIDNHVLIDDTHIVELPAVVNGLSFR